MPSSKKLRKFLFILALVNLSLAYSEDVKDPPSVPVKEEFQKILLPLGLNLKNPLEPLAVPYLREIKVAIIDVGFNGYNPGTKLLPASTEDHSSDLSKVDPQIPGPDPEVDHGFKMAQILWELTGVDPQGPKLYLLSSNGLDNFKYSVDFIVKNKIDIVVMANNWEYGGSGRNDAFFNHQVFQASYAGSLWIQAAGNYGNVVYSSKILAGLEDFADYLRLPDSHDHDHLDFKVKDPRPDPNEGTEPLINVTVTLSWSDFSRKSEEDCTQKDLDLILENANGLRLAEDQGHNIQDGKKESEALAQEGPHSCDPYEQINLSLPPGDYHVLIKDKSKNFSEEDDYRVVVTGVLGAKHTQEDLIEMPSATKAFELFNPADNKTVLTIGSLAPYSSKGPSLDGTQKPEVRIQDLSFPFKSFNGDIEKFGGSSASSAFVGAMATRQLAIERSRKNNPNLKISTEQWRSYFEKNKGLWKTPQATESLSN